MQVKTQNTLFKDLPISALILNDRFEIESYSEHLVHEFLPKKTELTGKHIAEAIPFLPSLFFTAINDCFVYKCGDENPAVQYVNYRNDIQWLKWRITPRIKEDNTINLLVYLEEVSKLKQMEDFFTRVEEVALVGGWQLNIKTSELFWTDVTKLIHEVPNHYTPQLKEGLKFYKEGEHRQRIQQLVDNAIKYGISYNEELIIVTAKGNEKWVRAKGETDFVNGECVRLFGTFQDIDKEKRSEIAMERTSNRLQTATSSGRIGIWEYEFDTGKIIWDKNMYSLFGINPKSFVPHYTTWENTLHPEDKERIIKDLQLAKQGIKPFNTEYRIIAKYNRVRHLKAQGTIVYGGKGEPTKMIGSNWDITESKENEARLKQLLKVTTSQNEGLLNFAHIVSHNLRSHASNIAMLSNFLDDDLKDSGANSESLQLLKTAAKNLNETIVHLNEVVEVKTNATEKLKNIAVKPILENVLESIDVSVKDANTKLTHNLTDNTKVPAVAAYLDSILLNLISNSIRYKHPERDLKLNIEFTTNKDSKILSIKDNGIGINLKKHRKKLFGMYKTFHDHSEARGIGLFISKNQMESMNGEISVESKEGVGSTFYLTFYNNK